MSKTTFTNPVRLLKREFNPQLCCVSTPQLELYSGGRRSLLFPLWDTLSRYYSQMTSSLNLKGLLHMHDCSSVDQSRMNGGRMQDFPRICTIVSGEKKKKNTTQIQQPQRLWLVASPIFTSLMMSSAVSLAPSQASPLFSVMSRAGGAGSQLQGDTQGRRCPAHYHIITLPGVWDWTLAMRLSQNGLLLTNLTHLGTLILFGKKHRRYAKGEASRDGSATVRLLSRSVPTFLRREIKYARV